ncbi:phospholipase A and acyltransferase 1-like [Vidua macroura]|uniref:phospholipase A and acyltransferase 1-like n=1 Tax=Vidua macroura TaxID=187451 RepID=UPI0023A8BE1D|nr:phospholipase A and acyltransferase 1-like [Vidua macroura]
MGQDNCNPQPGDLIEIDRTGYQHWALYVGDGYVIHVTDEGATSFTLSSSSIRATTAKVKKEILKDVVGNDKWRVNNKYDRYCTPRPVEEIIRRAEQWIDREVAYNVLNRNCEHFVTMLRYRKGVSAQAAKAVSSAAAAAGAGVAFVTEVGLPAVACSAGVAAVAGVVVIAGVAGAAAGVALLRMMLHRSASRGSFY